MAGLIPAIFTFKVENPPVHNELREKKKRKLKVLQYLFIKFVVEMFGVSLIYRDLSSIRSLRCTPCRVALPLQRIFQRILQSDWERAYLSALADSDSSCVALRE